MNVVARLPKIDEARIRDLAWHVQRPKPVTGAEREELIARIKRLLKERDAVLVAHYYVDADLQMLAEETGGYVSDSLDMARFGNDHPASSRG